MSVSAVDVVAADGRPARRRRRFVLWGVCGVLVVALAAAFIVPLPYYVDAPGQVTGTEPRISVSGRQSFATPGRVMFTTVSQQQATAALLVRSWLDDTIDTIPDEVAAKIPITYAKQHKILPLAEHDGIVYCATVKKVETVKQGEAEPKVETEPKVEAEQGPVQRPRGPQAEEPRVTLIGELLPVHQSVIFQVRMILYDPGQTAACSSV